jgi:Na+/alanine symporter
LKIGLFVVLFIAVFIALVAYSTMHGPRYRAEICMTFDGRKACKTVSAKSEEAAIRAGTEGSCADIASGVTETMKCVGAEPASIRWLQRP